MSRAYEIPGGEVNLPPGVTSKQIDRVAGHGYTCGAITFSDIVMLNPARGSTFLVDLASDDDDLAVALAEAMDAHANRKRSPLHAAHAAAKTAELFDYVARAFARTAQSRDAAIIAKVVEERRDRWDEQNVPPRHDADFAA